MIPQIRRQGYHVDLVVQSIEDTVIVCKIRLDVDGSNATEKELHLQVCESHHIVLNQ